jgi:hypothetical protein
MRSLDEILRLARELPAAERRKLLEELVRLDRDEMLSREENDKAWADWITHGPQGPMEDDGSPWP